jgi:hypothetical protein
VPPLVTVLRGKVKKSRAVLALLREIIESLIPKAVLAAASQHAHQYHHR